MAVIAKSKRTEPRLSKAIYAERTASRRTIRVSRKSRMQLRHAAALALVGWYLMTPPLSLSSSHQAGVDLSKPLSEWVRIESYDTASDCNKEIEAINNRAVSYAREHHAMMLELFHGQCVATDDPRLKER
jgi:hypothetical protein